MKNQDLNVFLAQLNDSLIFDDYWNVIHNTNFKNLNLNPYIYFQKDQYTRNRILKTDKFELLLLCWMEGQKSKIHNHGDSKCIMTCIAGKFLENSYELSSYVKANTNQPILGFKSSRKLNRFDTFCNHSSSDIHEILNINSGFSISLHLYIPVLSNPIFYKLEQPLMMCNTI